MAFVQWQYCSYCCATSVSPWDGLQRADSVQTHSTQCFFAFRLAAWLNVNKCVFKKGRGKRFISILSEISI